MSYLRGGSQMLELNSDCFFNDSQFLAKLFSLRTALAARRLYLSLPNIIIINVFAILSRNTFHQNATSVK